MDTHQLGYGDVERRRVLETMVIVPTPMVSSLIVEENHRSEQRRDIANDSSHG